MEAMSVFAFVDAGNLSTVMQFDKVPSGRSIPHILYHFDRKFSHASQPEKKPPFKIARTRKKFIGLLGQQVFRIRELTVEMVQ